MTTSRRNFIKTVAAGAIGSTFVNNGSLNLFAKSTVDKQKGIKISDGYYVFDSETQKILNAAADIFYPRASEINISSGFFNYFSRPENKKEAEFFDASLWNLDSISYRNFQKRFYELKGSKKKMKVMNYFYSRNKGFVEKLKVLTTDIYFSNPIICKELGYEGPPQPKGFLDYTEAP